MKKCSVEILKMIMKRFPIYPDPDCPMLRERFNLRDFTSASCKVKDIFMQEMAQARYDQENEFPFHNHLGMSKDEIRDMLGNKVVLELGSFCGGTSASYVDNYNIGKLYGLDIEDIFIDTAKKYNEKRKDRFQFVKAFGEDLPFDDESFDAIITYDVLEHVFDLDRVIGECWRVLKRGGLLLAVFPSFYHPLGNHLTLVTSAPWLHLFFGDESIEEAYQQIIDERGESAYWYKTKSSYELHRNRFHGVNGITTISFTKLCRKWGFYKMHEGRNPLFKSSKRLEKQPHLKLVSLLLKGLVYLPGVKELFLQQSAFVMRK